MAVDKNVIYSRILISRGNRTDLPNLHDGEMGFCADTRELFIGYDSENIPILTSAQSKDIYNKIADIHSSLDYFKSKEDHIHYDLIVGGRNLVSNGNFMFGDIDGKLGINYIGKGLAEIRIEDIEDKGIGSNKALHVINTNLVTSGINIDFINEVDSYRLIGKEFTLQYWASYKDIIPDEPLLGDGLKLGKINVIYTFEDGTSETEEFISQEIKTGSNAGKKHVFHFKLSPKDRTITNVYASLSFVMESCTGEFFVTGIQLEEGNIDTSRRMSEQDILYISEGIYEKYKALYEEGKDQVIEVKQQINEIGEKIITIDSEINDLSNKIDAVDFRPINILRNTGEFFSTAYWHIENPMLFNIKEQLDRTMKIRKISDGASRINIELNETMNLKGNINFTMIYRNERLDNRLRIKLLDSSLNPVLDMDDYSSSIDGAYIIFTFSKEINNDLKVSYLSIYDDYFIPGESIFVKNMKLSRILNSSEWEPSPLDTVGEFTDFHDRIANIEDSSEIYGNRMEYVEERISKISETLGSDGKIKGEVSTDAFEDIPCGTVLDDNVKDIVVRMLTPNKPISVTEIKVYDDMVNYNEIKDFNTLGKIIAIGRVEVKFKAYNELITNAVLRVNNTSSYECEIDNERNIATYYFNKNLRSSKDINFTITLTSNKNKITSAQKDIKFMAPIFYGSTASTIGELTEADIIAANKNEEYESSIVNFRFTHSRKRPFIAIPNERIDEIKAIVDDMSHINYIKSFKIKTVRILLNSRLYDYSVYVMTPLTNMYDTNFMINLEGGSILW